MANRFDIVAIEVDDEGAIVVGVIVRSQARRAIVAPSGRERGAIKRVGVGSGACGEGDVSAALRSVARPDPEKRLSRRAKPGVRLCAGLRRGKFIKQGDSEWGKRADVESLGAFDVRDGQSDVIQHVPLPGRLR